jgi:CSLREA domain-containing protein
MFTNRTITRFFFTLIVLTSLFFTSLGITPAYAASIVVNTAVDEIAINGFCSLREAITNANNNFATYTDCPGGIGIDTITFAGNYTITLAGASLPTITSEIVIKGNGSANTIIQANASPNTATYRVFLVNGSPGKLTLDSLTVRHGRCNGECAVNYYDGGGILINGSTLIVINSSLIANNGLSGGAVANYGGGTLTITNSTISGNVAGGNGAGIYSNQSNLTVTNSSISGNIATNTHGGGIYSFDSNWRVTNSTISGNTAGISGGGISTYSGGTSFITDSTISGNTADYGGGIHGLNNLTVIASTISGNSASKDGGGIYKTNSSVLQVIDSTISGNSATYNGGGVYNLGSSSSLSVSRSTFYGNSSGTGGAISNTGSMSLANTTISGNEAYDYGGGIYNGGTASIYNSTIVFNTLVVGEDFGAGGIDGSVALYNSIVAGNTRLLTSQYRDCSGTLYLGGVNAFWNTTNCSMDPGSPGYSTSLYSLNELGPLQDNGGPTWTHALIPIEEGSRAIDAGNNAICASSTINNLDQRWVTRPQGSRCDIGAYEFIFPFDPMTQWTTDYSYNAQQWRVEYHPRLTGDVDGDGDDDIVGFGFDRVLVALSNGLNGFAPMQQWTMDYSYNAQGWRTEYHPRLLGDVNGDSRADIVGFGYDRVLVALSTGTSFAPMQQWTTDYSYNAQGWRTEYHPRLLGDVNGDGRADIVGFGYDRVLVALSTGTSFASMQQWTTDYSYNAQGWRTEYHPRVLGDVDGDGDKDIIGFGYDRVLVAKSNGLNNFAPMQQWTTDYSYNAQGWRTEFHPRLTGDFNGDGKDDLIGFGYDRVLVATAP